MAVQAQAAEVPKARGMSRSDVLVTLLILLVGAVFLVLVPLFRRRIPFAMSWWALTFPTGALAVSSGVTGAATGVTTLARRP